MQVAFNKLVHIISQRIEKKNDFVKKNFSVHYLQHRVLLIFRMLKFFYEDCMNHSHKHIKISVYVLLPHIMLRISIAGAKLVHSTKIYVRH